MRPPLPRRTAVPALAVLGLALSGAPAAQAAVTVSPQPGTPTASYKTQISLRGVAPAAIGTLRVTGSRSGRHPGTVRAHSDGQGASFLPRTPFRRGERVTVATDLDVVGATRGDYGFTVAGLGNAGAIVVAPEPPSKVGAGAREAFRSRPDLAPPRTATLLRAPGTAPGSIFLNARNRTGRGQQGPMIVDDVGELIWFKAVGDGRKATDAKVQVLGGKPVLTWWQGRARQGAGSGEHVVVDDAYRTVATIRAGNGYRSDLHELTLTPQGTALVLTYNPIPRDLSGVGGAKRGRVVDGVVQEIDVATGLVRFEWHTLGRIGLGESHSRPAPSPRIPYDYAHLNSVSLDGDGALLISARGTWAAYRVDRATGAIDWRLGGKRSSFAMGPGTAFAWQHDVERRADGTLSLFDNSAAPPVRRASRAVVLRLDETGRKASLVSAFTHPKGLLAANQGSVQTLPNGNLFVGWGPQRRYSEFTPAGELVFDGTLSEANDTYRARRFAWSATPVRRPAVAAQSRGARRSAVYASLNGSTQVARWEVLAGRTREALGVVASTPRDGFETEIAVAGAGPYFAVRALDAGGAPLGTSATVRRR